MILDSRVDDIMQLISLCVCEEFAGEPLCFCGEIAGALAYDAMGVGGECYDGDGDETGSENCGQAWVRLASAFPARGVGVPETTPANCASSIGLTVEIGALRCIRIEENGLALPADEMLEAVRLQRADMLAIMRAIMCCDGLDSNQYSLGAYTPVGPEGGIVGGFWLLSVLVD